MSDLIEIVEKFQIFGVPEKIEPFGGGHINKTYKVSTKESYEKNYLLQKINHKVFTDVDALMDNICKVTSHIKEKASSDHQGVLRIIPTLQGRLFYKDADRYWRVFEFLGDACSYDKAETKKQAFEAAKMFGLFLKDLSDFSPRKLHITIQDFHNINVRLKQFNQALIEADSHRIEKAIDQVNMIEEYQKLAINLYQSADSGDLPLRVTHNDTKFNNVLLDKDEKGYAVIDLDTVMPGYVFFDVGDGVRSRRCNGRGRRTKP
ncbi:MAG: aminoglycoside phosphotransferase family protein [Balneolaceae bacterium]|nr:aminoglycoside phosphotransferase family protein [Balneolaceae bacterium]